MTVKAIKVEVGDTSIEFSPPTEFTVKSLCGGYGIFTSEGLLAWQKDMNRVIDSMLRLLDQDESPQKTGEWRYHFAPAGTPPAPTVPPVPLPEPRAERHYFDPPKPWEELLRPKNQHPIFVDGVRTHRDETSDSRANGVNKPF